MPIDKRTIMVVEHGTVLRVVKDALPSRPIDEVMAGKDVRAAAIPAAPSTFVPKGALRADAPADVDAILLAGRGLSAIVPAAHPGAEEQVVVPAVVVHVRPFDGMGASAVESDLAVQSAGGGCVFVQPHLVDVVPEGAEVEVVCGPNLD